tara:strand:- start:30 stop:473 length:444 start_codon:yes stop_codon:yes gene_type:complete
MPIRLSKIHEWLIYALSTIVFISGVTWLYFFYFVRIEGEFGLLNHPFQNTSLVIHGTSSIFLMIALGSVLPVHVMKAWKVKRNRLSGGIFLSLFITLVLSGIGLYYLGTKWAQDFTSIIHWVTGLFFPIFLGVHVYFGKKSYRKKAD